MVSKIQPHINNLQVSEEAFNSYCYISSTFTLPAEGITSHMYPGVQPHHGKRPTGWSNRIRIGNFFDFISNLDGRNQVKIWLEMLFVSPCTEFDDEVMYHNYYQWVSYLLFIQSLRSTMGELLTNSVLTKFSWFFFSFFMPLTLHAFLENGRVQRILVDLNNIILDPETRQGRYSTL